MARTTERDSGKEVENSFYPCKSGGHPHYRNPDVNTRGTWGEEIRMSGLLGCARGEASLMQPKTVTARAIYSGQDEKETLT